MSSSFGLWRKAYQWFCGYSCLVFGSSHLQISLGSKWHPGTNERTCEAPQHGGDVERWREMLTIHDMLTSCSRSVDTAEEQLSLPLSLNTATATT
eukprot:2166651-Amphidinium_carterae.1